MTTDIVAAVFFDEEKDTVRVELTNFLNKDEAMETANLIIAALGITKVEPLKITQTLH
jgi:hypothetical protein